MIKLPWETGVVSESIQSRAIREDGIWSGCRRRGRGFCHLRL